MRRDLGPAGAGASEQQPVGCEGGIQVGVEAGGVGGLRQRVQSEQEDRLAVAGDQFGPGPAGGQPQSAGGAGDVQQHLVADGLQTALQFRDDLPGSGQSAEAGGQPPHPGFDRLDGARPGEGRGVGDQDVCDLPAVRAGAGPGPSGERHK